MGLAIRIIIWGLEIYSLLVILYVLMLWAFHLKIIPSGNTVILKIWDMLSNMVEPLLERIKLLLPPAWMFDLSPVVLLIVLYMLQRILFILFL